MSLLTPRDYREKFLRELTDGFLSGNNYFHHLLDFFDQVTQEGYDAKMLEFPSTEHVPGGAWPGNYGRVTITDWRDRKMFRGGVKVVLENGDIEYHDQEGSRDLVPRVLNTTAQNIARAIESKRRSYHNLPHWVGDKYRERLLVKINGTVCQGYELTDEMLTEVLTEMTPFERSKYEQSLYNIDVSLLPSVEQPIKVRIDGVDDCAEEALFADLESANKALEDLANWNSKVRREDHGFRGTD